jgi:hypothetical protein
MLHENEDVCVGCRTIIAPSDPDRVERGTMVWHGSCLKVRRMKIRLELQEQAKLLKGLGERSGDAQMKTLGDWGDECT